MNGRLPDDGLVAELGHRPLVVDDLIDVRAARIAIDPDTGHQSAAQVRPVIRWPNSAGFEHRGHEVAWRNVGADRDRLGRVEPQPVQRRQHVEELIAEAVFERDSVDVEPRHQQHFFVLDVDAFQLPDPLGKMNCSGSEKGRS
jgi:hypothetical protein